MEPSFDFIESVQDDLINENIFYNLNTLNEYIKVNDANILLVNIRSLNANFVNLQVFIESLGQTLCDGMY